MSTSGFSPNSIKPAPTTTTNENDEKSDLSSKIFEKRYTSGPVHHPEPLLSPSKRQFLKQMSPNITKKQHRVISNEPISKPPNFVSGNTKKESNFPRPQLPHLLKKPSLDQRSKTTIAVPSMATAASSSFSSSSSSSSSLSVPFTLRRSNSLLSRTSSSSIEQQKLKASDRFIPSRHYSATRKLDPAAPEPEPNASPQKHIEAQTSKIYQHHVAEACGLEVNSRILLYQPLPPERKKPLNLQASKYKVGNKSLPPLLASARAKKIPVAPERVLDAPGLVDDFYLNLLAWSSYNLLAIGLEDAVYVWNASTGSVGLLCELPEKTLVTSLKWSQDGSYVSIGKEDGLIEIWDIEQNVKLRTINCDNHLTRITSQAWSQHTLTSGSRIGNLYHSDVRIASHLVSKAEGCHSSEISGIEYRPDLKQFVTGGNDNLVNIWDVRNNSPLFSKRNHKAAVKAMSWCPYQTTLLATGGGSTDRTINFWNTSTGARVSTIDTGSQISSLNWGYAGGTGMEIVATHGFPTNSISLFNYPTLQKTGEIMNAHDTRILNGCLSPDNLTLATIAGDENLKFWSLFDMDKSYKRIYNEEDVDENNDVKEHKRIKRMMSFR
ncbi:slp1 [Candida oxycetoniae]|uniref:Slp1 n=1 Tax=Candida oxycetoniae TaxID=497107 RepID=A0AAI9X0B9_9ASCO|nr:slp1 [Candida oxycetoniae]KAI3407118.2 slp1 [Candida oxycetoniae]